MEFNEFCVSAGESARATLITLCNELRSGDRRKTKALSSPAASGRQNKRAACTHFEPTWTSVRDRDGGMLTFFSPGYHPHVKGNEM